MNFWRSGLIWASNDMKNGLSAVIRLSMRELEEDEKSEDCG